MGPSESTPSKEEHKDDFSHSAQAASLLLCGFFSSSHKAVWTKKMAEGKKDLIDSPMVASSPILLMEEKA